jgi:transcriptional regulator with XRE-family HTH domain
MTFQKIFKENRKKIGYTQEEVATYLNVTPQAVSKWETGQGTPDLSLIIPIAQLFDITTDELLGNNKNVIEIDQELNDIYLCKNDLLDKYQSYTKLLKQSPSNINIIKRCINCAWSMLLSKKSQDSLGTQKIEELLSDMERYRDYLKNKCTTDCYNEFAKGKLAEAYIVCGKFEQAKEIINDSTLYQLYNQDRLNGFLYYQMLDNENSRTCYEMSISAGLELFLKDLIMVASTYADFRGIGKCDVHNFIKTVKTVYDIVSLVCNTEFPYPYHKYYIKACEFLAQGYMDMNDKETSLVYLEKFVSVLEKWKESVNTKPDLNNTCFILSNIPEEIDPISPFDTAYVKMAFNRNKYRRFGDDERFISLKQRIEKII